MNPMLLYIDSHSFLHRWPAYLKIIILVIFAAGIFTINQVWLLFIVFIAILYLTFYIKIKPMILIKQLKSMLWMLLFIFIFQLYFYNLMSGCEVILRLLILLIAALLLTWTTKTSDLIIAIERGLTPLKPIGINPEKVSLAISLVFRFIPVLSLVMKQVQEAQQVRGLDKNMLALIFPFVIQSLKMCDTIAQAIDARDP